MCGIIGVTDAEKVVDEIYGGLLSLQHRGQDSAGMTLMEDNHLQTIKGFGLLREVFTDHQMECITINPQMGIGHVRYPTSGKRLKSEIQPFYVNHPYGIVLSHNGNLTNKDELKEYLNNEKRRHIESSSDSEVLLNILATEIDERVSQNDGEFTVEELFLSIEKLHEKVRGSYSVVCLIAGKGLLAFRDKYGIRPICLGRKKKASGDITYIVASETIALKALGYEYVRDLEPGEAIFIDKNNDLYSRDCSVIKINNPCVFEFIYLARPDSEINGISVYKSRQKMGERIGERIKKEWNDKKIDVVIPIPDSGRVSAVSLAETLNLPCRDGLVKDRYTGRTFIMSGDELRQKSVRKKLTAIREEIEGKNVLLVDDSIVRGNTSRHIVDVVQKAGAKKIYLVSVSPPVKYCNFYGIDIPSKIELIANNRSEKDIGKLLGVDDIMFQSLTDLRDIIIGMKDDITDIETSCFDGYYIDKDSSINNYFNDCDSIKTSRPINIVLNSSIKNTESLPEFNRIESHFCDPF